MARTQGTLQFGGEKSPSVGPKVGITTWYMLCIASATWLTYFRDGTDVAGSTTRHAALLLFALIYVARASSSLFVFVTRKIPWWEAAYGGGMIGIVLFTFLLQGLRAVQPLESIDALGVICYAAGSYLGTASEYHRHRWKRKPENAGLPYTQGLFRYSRHINYFGDLLLFAGLGVLTRQVWTLIVPVAMGLNFVLFLIPAQDAYLAAKYGNTFAEYARQTKKLIPFLY